MTAAGESVTRTFEPSAEAPRAARRFIASEIDEIAAVDVIDHVVLLVSELVTNAVLHARTPVVVDLSVRPDALHVAVSDGSATMPSARSFSDMAGSGRGLHLVESLADRWGVEPDGTTGGKRVWFEIDPSGSGASMVFDLDSVESI